VRHKARPHRRQGATFDNSRTFDCTNGQRLRKKMRQHFHAPGPAPRAYKAKTATPDCNRNVQVAVVVAVANRPFSKPSFPANDPRSRKAGRQVTLNNS
jgi:hypothetical protein